MNADRARAGDWPVAPAGGGHDRGVFLYAEGYWTVAFGGAACHLRDSKGLHYVAILLSRPGQRIPAIELVRRVAGTGDVHAPSDRAGRERARLNVIRAVDSALRRLKQHHPVLRAHLEHTLRTGLYCGYTPDARLPIHWEV